MPKTVNQEFQHTPGPWIDGNTSDSIVAPSSSNSPDSDNDFYGGCLIAESVAPHNKALIKAAHDLLAAAIAQEEAEDFNANDCPDCADDGSTELPELCEHCFPHFDKARLMRRAAIAKAVNQQAEEQ